MTQLRILFGQIIADELATRFPDGIPRWADIVVIGLVIHINQIFDFDEVHWKEVIGGAGHDRQGCRVQM